MSPLSGRRIPRSTATARSRGARIVRLLAFPGGEGLILMKIKTPASIVRRPAVERRLEGFDFARNRHGCDDVRARRNELARTKIASLSNDDRLLVNQNGRVFVFFLFVLFFRIVFRLLEVRWTSVANPNAMDTPIQSTGE